MSDWQTYSLEDFIPFTPDIYWRLIERINETFWPLHLLTIALGIAALFFALRGRPSIALVLLAPAWLNSGIIFHFIYYAELHWAAPWFGWAFIVQAVLLLAAAALTRQFPTEEPVERVSIRIGATISVGALIAYPLIAVTLGPGSTHAETYGLHPDPTAIATLGVLLTALRGASACIAFTIPFLWCLVASFTLIPLDAAWAWLPATVAVIAAIFFGLASIGARRSGAGK